MIACATSRMTRQVASIPATSQRNPAVLGDVLLAGQGSLRRRDIVACKRRWRERGFVVPGQCSPFVLPG